MKIENETIKIEMSINDVKELRTELNSMINDIRCTSEQLAGYFDEARLREIYPKVNEFLGLLNVRDELPF